MRAAAALCVAACSSSHGMPDAAPPCGLPDPVFVFAGCMLGGLAAASVWHSGDYNVDVTLQPGSGGNTPTQASFVLHAEAASGGCANVSVTGAPPENLGSPWYVDDTLAQWFDGTSTGTRHRWTVCVGPSGTAFIEGELLLFDPEAGHQGAYNTYAGSFAP